MKLFEYQQKIVDEKYEDSKALFMDMGTGKTFVSMGMYLKSGCRKLLVVCLATKVNDWVRDLENEIDLNPIGLNKSRKKNLESIQSENDTLVVSFESSWRLAEELLKWVDEDTYIIVDESHKIKNPSSKVGKFAHKLGKKTPFKSILTGTPQSRGYIDYFNQFRFLGYLEMTQTAFKKRYTITELMQFGTGPMFEEIVGYKNTDELDEMIHRHSVYYDRELSDEEVPTETVVDIPKYPKYRKISKDKVYEFEDGSLEIYDSLGARMMLERQLASGYIAKNGNLEVLDKTKINWTRDFLEGYDGRVVIFYNYNAELRQLRELMDKLKRPYSEYNGSLKDLTNFQNREDGVVLANYGSASTGINDLVIAHTMIMYSLTTSYIDFEQAKKRIDRLGQTKKPMFYYLVMTGTIDASIWRNLQDGKDFDERMFEEHGEYYSRVD